jgi:hypothetical protein
MKIEEVSPEEVPNFRESHRGRVSYPILKTFLETDYLVGKLDRTGMQQGFQALYSSLSAYIRSHDLPIKIFSRSGDIYLARLDRHPDGSENPNWREQAKADTAGQAPVAIDAAEVARRFAEEKDQTTK